MSEFFLRIARTDDVPALVRMLADDELGATREDPGEPLAKSYLTAFAAIDKDPHNELVVAENGSEVVGMLQLTLTPHLTYKGRSRASIEGVRVDRRFRSAGIGRMMFEWAINRAKDRGCHLVQLTTDKSRPDAIRFYESLGFIATHEGMKLKL